MISDFGVWTFGDQGGSIASQPSWCSFLTVSLVRLQESSEEEESDEEPAPAAKKAKAENGVAKTKPAAAAVDTGAAQGSRTIFIKNLPWSADEAMLNEFFTECGTIAETRIGEHSHTYSTNI